MASIFPVWLVLVVVLGLMAASWILPKKGPNQTLVRSSLMLTLACCYLMWMIAYMAQLHPLIAPRHNLAVEAKE
ncbi:ATPase, V0 complex, subunit E1/e2 [Vararia minispora EC-137]|uniref:ATPase, V0 complex, subunit E1/e2 n=1 Tax=Vararia minispora EC-137 TaxID=1314806 RepID=A0ACB8QC99_9AGAM|nr:ATPase, V0 complex, subunit E1/e2 [Vararia minispora EC-137]